MSELVPPIRVPADKQISRWHPQFKLDEIPDIVAAENALPAKPPPVKVSTALEVIAKAKSILEHANPRMRQAVISIVNNASKEPPQAVSSVAAQPKASAKLKALKGVSKSLLEKVNTFLTEILDYANYLLSFRGDCIRKRFHLMLKFTYYHP